MSTYDDAHNTERKSGKATTNAVGDPNYEVSHLRENINGLNRTVKSMSEDKARIAGSYLREIAVDLRASGTRTLSKAEDHIRQEPGKSVAFAFAAGLIASLLLGRRKV